MWGEVVRDRVDVPMISDFFPAPKLIPAIGRIGKLLILSEGFPKVIDHNLPRDVVANNTTEVLVQLASGFN